MRSRNIALLVGPGPGRPDGPLSRARPGAMLLTMTDCGTG